MIGHHARFRENDYLPLWQGPATKKKPPFCNAHALITRKIMRSSDAQLGNNLKRVNLWVEVRKVEADRRAMERLGHFHRTRSQAFACAKMASAPKKLRQTLLTTVFEGQHEFKTLNVFF